MKYRTVYHLILDRDDPNNPRWVIAKEYASRPAQVPEGFTLPDGAKWLREFSYREFDWMKIILGRDSHLMIPQRGHESFSTRISHHTSVWTEYTVAVERDPIDPSRDDGDDHDDHDDPERWSDEVTDD